MTLPITSFKNEIIDAVNNYDITIVTAETGSGKSTQIPQYLSEYYEQIIVTEPRIMAAITLAKRVSEEMGTTLGEQVGYRTGYDKCSSAKSQILFCTDGLQLIRTIFEEDNQKQNVLIIDEVHEWNLNIETLISWVKLMRNTWKTKVVIMSATMEAESLSNYFGGNVAILNIPGTLYDVSVEERNEFDLKTTIKENIEKNKNILVFVPGKKEIAEVIESLDEYDATVLPLHGELDWEEQKKCFDQYYNSKVVVATNVAQTSLTIPDIDVVVDTGKARISIAKNGVQGLYLTNISKADIMQRKGRAGRTKEGKYYLCSNFSLASREEYTIPEIKRSILDRVVLQLAAIGLDAEKLEFYHQPEKEAILNAKQELKALGAVDNNFVVTEMGHKIVKIPVSVQFGRMIVEAEKYGVTEQVLTISAIIQFGGLLSKKANYSDFTQEKRSDLLAELDVWNYIKHLGYIDFKNLGINKKVFFKIREHIKKLKETMYGLVEITSNDDRKAIVKSCIFGLISNIYRRDFGNHCSKNTENRQINNNTCLDYFDIKWVVGIPTTIEFKDKWGYLNHLNLLNFVTKIDDDMICELVPEEIEEETKISYNGENAVEIETKKKFRGYVIKSETYLDENHPELKRLKKEYEEKMKSNSSYFVSKETITIDGKEFEIVYSFGKPYIMIDDKTLFKTKESCLFLENGERLYITSSEVYPSKKYQSIQELKNVVMNERFSRLRIEKEYEYEKIKATTIEKVINNKDKIGKTELSLSLGEKEDPLTKTLYGCIYRYKNEVNFELIEDKELANSNTTEALQYLFIKEISAKYSEKKFHKGKKTKKKVVLTEEEREMKMNFDSLVREVLQDLTIENCNDNLEFLEEYYQDLMQ